MAQCNTCNKEFAGRGLTCSTCRSKLSRARKNLTTPPSATPATPADETREQWLARRIKESRSLSSIFVKIGYPPGSKGRIEIPSKWSLSDIEEGRRWPLPL